MVASQGNIFDSASWREACHLHWGRSWEGSALKLVAPSELSVSPLTTHPQLIILCHEGRVATTAGDPVHLLSELDLLRGWNRVGVAVAKLALKAVAPGKDVALVVHVGGVVLTARKVLDLPQESLNACWMGQHDVVEPGYAQLAVAIVAERVKLALVVQDHRKVGPAEYFLDPDGEVELLRLCDVLEVAVTELPVPTRSPGIQATVRGDASSMPEATGYLFHPLRRRHACLVDLGDLHIAELRVVRGPPPSKPPHRPLLGLLRLHRVPELAVGGISERQEPAISSDCRDVVFPAADLSEEGALTLLEKEWSGQVGLESRATAVDDAPVPCPSPKE